MYLIIGTFLRYVFPGRVLAVFLKIALLWCQLIKMKVQKSDNDNIISIIHSDIKEKSLMIRKSNIKLIQKMIKAIC